MTTIPQRLREIAVDLNKSICREQASMSASELLVIAAELEAPAADAVPVVAWEVRDSAGFVCIEYDASAANAAEKDGWKTDPLVRQLDHIATVAALQSRIKSLEAENFALAAGQCVVPGGLCGDEGGSQYCSLQQAASNAKASP